MSWAKVQKLLAETVTRLREADGDAERIDQAVRRYITRGDALRLSPFVLWDYFAISSPTIPEEAGYCGYESDRIVATFGRLMKERYGG